MKRKQSEVRMSLTDILKLNIRGRILYTARSNLLSEPSSVLAKMFALDQSLAPTVIVDGGHFIDADPDCFQVLLNWMTYRKILLPRNLTPEAVVAVAEFYDLVDLCKELETYDEKRKKILSKLEVKEYSNSLLSDNRWGICWNENLRHPTLTQKIDDTLIGLLNHGVLDVKPDTEEKPVFVLTIHPSERVNWVPCKDGVVAENALAYSKQESFFLAYRYGATGDYSTNALEYFGDFKIVVKGKGLCKIEEERNQNDFDKENDYSETYYVLCIDKI